MTDLTKDPEKELTEEELDFLLPTPVGYRVCQK
jgi:hypothetical protein